MRRAFTALAILIAGLTPGTGQDADRLADGTDRAAVERGVHATLAAQADAWNAGDIPGYMRGYVRSEELRFASGGTVRRGWNTTLARYSRRYDSPDAMGHLTFSDIEVTPITDSIAEVFGRFHLERQSERGNASGLFTLLMVRRNGDWLILHDHTSAADPTDASDSNDASAPPPDDATEQTLARLHAELDAELDSQLAEFEEFDRQATDSVSRLSTHGDLMLFTGRYDEAVADYRRMVELQPALARSHWRLGIALYFAGQWKDAADVFDAYHSYDQVDRENGIWRFLCHHKAFGPEKAAEQLLRYEKDDRPPFPHVYQMFEGRLSLPDVLAALPDDLNEVDRESRLFYIHLYAGLQEAVAGNTNQARPHLQQAVLNAWPRTASFGPHYMWHVARRQLLDLNADPDASASTP